MEAESRSARPSRTGYVIGTYPSLTTTFIDREIRALRSLGHRVEITSLRRPSGILSAEQLRLGDSVDYFLPIRARRLLRSQLRFAWRPRYWSTLFAVARWPHPSLKKRFRTLGHFVLGVAVADALAAKKVSRVHAHFLDRAALVAMVATRLLKVPYSATAHANDIYVDPVLLREKITSADFVVTCTEFNVTHLRSELGPDADGVSCLYHGLDVSNYEPPTDRVHPAPVVLAVGQLKEKKGFADLIHACGVLRDRNLDLRCVIIGSGPLQEVLQDQIDQSGLGERVELAGAKTHDAVIDAYRQADLFVLPSVTSADGGRDGIPNVVLEAMAMQLAVVSTRTSGIPEAVVEDLTGLLVEPGDRRSLADAMETLLADEARREAMGRAGRCRVADSFSVESNVGALAARFESGGQS